MESKDEIIRLLDNMMLAGTPCAAYTESKNDFLVCSIIGIEAGQDAAYLRHDAETVLLGELLKSRSIQYVAAHEDARIQFLSTPPQASNYRGHTALRIPLPKLLWRMQRRAHPRHPMSRGQIHILLNFAGIGSVEAEAADISIDGIGIIHYHPQLRLEPGLIMDDCEIHIPDESPIKVRMRIQHSTPIQFPDGEIVKRAGCQFIDLSSAASTVLAAYLNSLKRHH